MCDERRNVERGRRNAAYITPQIKKIKENSEGQVATHDENEGGSNGEEKRGSDGRGKK
jgi:hypothetical protein